LEYGFISIYPDYISVRCTFELFYSVSYKDYGALHLCLCPLLILQPISWNNIAELSVGHRYIYTTAYISQIEGAAHR